MQPDDEYLNPTSLPAVSTISLPETVLPYYLTQSSDGNWYKVDNAWWLYGRVIDQNLAANPTGLAAASTTSSANTYAVISVLPRGWGVVDSRSSFYKTPLIVTASVILALIIVAGIIFITIQRRKTARRKKRHDARMRRKALTAAGLTEDDVRNADPDKERMFKDRLEEFERQHQLKKQRRPKTHQQVTFVRTKVRVWHKGLRKRKGGNDRDLNEKPETNGFSSTHMLSRNPRASPAPSSFTASQTSLASSRSSGSFDERRPRFAPPKQVSPEMPEHTDVGSDQTPETLVNSELPSSPTSASSNGQHSPQDPSPLSSPESQPQPQPVAGSSTQFSNLPPAYRPASVHSSGEGSSSAQPSSAMRNVAITSEKVAAAGFYPAPATAEAERAQVVAHRADAKTPIAPPPDDEENRARAHVATDDKRELERLRLGGSAPPVVRADDDDDEAGPSAPRFEVDDTGFEMLEPTDGQSEPSAPPRAVPAGIPAPPTPLRLNSLNTFKAASKQPENRDSMLGSAPPVSPADRLALRPSAPPLDFDFDDDDESHVSAPSAPPGQTPLTPSAPSAPSLASAPSPLLRANGHGHEHDSDALSSVASASIAPSAPPLDLDDGLDEADHAHADHDADAGSLSGDEHASAALEATSGLPSAAGDMRANLGVNGHRFLPRYEP